MTIKVFAPASIGNVSVGFDLLGMAVQPVNGELLGDLVSIEGCDGNDNQLIMEGPFVSKLPEDPKDNIVFACIELFQQQMQRQHQDYSWVKLTLEKRMPVGSGLGSSACSIVAALVALNEYYQKPFTDQQLLAMMGQMESKISGSLHYDNVAPCFLGGLQLMVNDPRIISREIPSFQQCYYVMAYSGIQVSTKAAREVLPDQYNKSTTIEFGQNLATFIDACYRQDLAQAMSHLRDVLAEPYRAELLPGFAHCRQGVTELGALASGISGSGPTMFVVSDSKQNAETIQAFLQQQYLQSEQGFVYICQTDVHGARLVC
ncbi:homoserine kinase [Thalassotalea mangrovi]|uniref:Homoserine kinase n=1 Tax=Thalassotalea mangrovi TaxID=2572245 RepID=A0A4U1B8B0_9GAMM|nr:homoserine kinase [Thalassotalea mangrovi]TKB46899.1 homoserine kinase [Thalassotalea mangrovi]